MNTSDLIETINTEVMDDTLTKDKTLSLLNRAQRAITQRLNFPELITSKTVTLPANQSQTALPENFQKNLFKCYAANDRKIKIFNSRKALQEHYGPDCAISSGSVYGVAIEGRNLVYALIPSNDTDIIVHYYRYPNKLQESTSSYPVLQDDPNLDDALMYWVKWKYYQLIEQGLEGNKPDTTYNRDEFFKAQRRLQLSLREGVSLPTPPAVEQPW